jgi:hypothetical protein
VYVSVPVSVCVVERVCGFVVLVVYVGVVVLVVYVCVVERVCMCVVVLVVYM